MSLLWKKKNHLCFCITNAIWKLLHIFLVNVLYFSLFSGERCLAEYFEKYLNAMNNTGKLAGQPIRYGTQAIGINKLNTMMKYFFSKTFLFLEIVILTMTSWHEKELSFHTWKSLIAVLNNAWKKKYLIFLFYFQLF